jgi:probable HAF family extracellular repeat protein
VNRLVSSSLHAGFALVSLFLPHVSSHAAYIVEQVAVLPEGSMRIIRALNDDEEIVGGARLRNKHHGLRLSRASIEQVEGSPGTDYSIALGVNEAGEIVGSANGAKALRAFRAARDLKPVDLGPLPGDSASEAFAVNRHGKAAGYSSGPGGARAVTWLRTGAIEALPALSGAHSSKAFAINDGDDVVGISAHAHRSRATRWSKGGVKDLGTLPGDSRSEALAINDVGDIVGSSGDSRTDRHAVLWSEEGTIQDLGTLGGGETSRALGINNRGEVVGVSHTPRGNQAFIWTRQGGMRNLNHLVVNRSAYVLTQALSINSRGVILAIGQEELEHVEEEGHSHDLHELPVHVFLLRPER